MTAEHEASDEPRNMPRWRVVLVTILSIAMFALNVWVTFNYDLDDTQVRALFLAFTFTLVFLLYPWTGQGRRPAWQAAIDVAAVAVGLFVTGYIVVGFDEVFYRAGAETTLDLSVAAAATLLVLEATRRSTGWALPLMAVAFLLYPALFGPYLPGLLRTAPFSVERVLATQYLSLSGILGPAFKVAIDFIFLFVLFGSCLNRLGVTKFFIDLSMAVSGRARGGSAKISILSSGLMGSISGSAVANVVTTGVVTIPLMKKEGFKASTAAGVEAVASTGGQLMPPIMGAAAFLMAEFTRIPYSDIIIYALCPALLYYLSIWIAVHWEAVRSGFKGIAADRLPRATEVVRERGLSLFPLLLVTVLLLAGYSLADSVLYGIASAIVVALIMPATRRLVTVGNLVAAVREGVESSMGLFASTACAGIIIGIVTMTGLGLKISTLIVDASGGILWIALLLAALTSIIFGMGLPTQIIYLTLAVLVAPAIVDMGVTVAGAHLFIMFFGMMSMVTPPVCFAAFAAASLAGAKMMDTGLVACRFAIPALLLPFYFVYHPGLLLIGDIWGIAESILRATAGLYAAGVAAGSFYFSESDFHESAVWPITALRRILCAVCTILLIAPGGVALLSGFLLFCAAMAVGPLFRRQSHRRMLETGK